MTAHQDSVPAGLTEEQVKAIVTALLNPQLDSFKDGIGQNIATLKASLTGDISNLEIKLAALNAELETATSAREAMSETLLHTQATIEESANNQQKQSAADMAAMDAKLAALKTELDELTSQSTAMSAMLSKCCQNKSVTLEDVRQEVLAMLAQV